MPQLDIGSVSNGSRLKEILEQNSSATVHNMYLDEGDFTSVLERHCIGAVEKITQHGIYLWLPVHKNGLNDLIAHLIRHCGGYTQPATQANVINGNVQVSIPICTGDPGKPGHWYLCTVTINNGRLCDIEHSDSLGTGYSRIAVGGYTVTKIFRDEQKERPAWSCLDHTIIEALRKLFPDKDERYGYDLRPNAYAYDDGYSGAKRLRDNTARIIRIRHHILSASSAPYAPTAPTA